MELLAKLINNHAARRAAQFAREQEVTAVDMEQLTYREWRLRTVQFICAHGMVADLIHIDETRWALWYFGGCTPAEAVDAATDELR